ncbi:sodium-coupled monocarboxylate transporter 1-like [Littorina saxatilis]|uniref:Sodium-coupled monocarboxylate transporter 1 n=1 Tax=Littorina saxatilis TaxID=31220 RepID=A0AAN9GKL3_9CAEN
MVENVSIVTGVTKTFSTLDYIIFAGILIISAGIGFYHAWKDRRKDTLKEFLLAGGNMQTLPVALSLVASFMSAITLLGTPVEMYQYSTMYFYIGIGYLLAMAGAAHIYVPIFYRLKITSAYEYLEMRFGKIVRTAGSLTFVVQMLLYMAIVLYAPSLALNAVTGFPLWGAVASVGIVCTIYTAFGGMKAVLWANCFLVGMILAGLFAVLIRGSMEVGGFTVAWDAMKKSGRVFFDDFRPDPNVRHSFWALVFGGYFTWVAIYGVNQAMVQRACTLPTLRRAQIALWLNVPSLWIILYVGCMIGAVVYAFYSKCDPISAGLIDSKDQLLPLFVMDVLGDITGLPGLFVACLFSGALSAISSGLNSIAAVILEDVIKAYFAKDLKEQRAKRITQILALIFGAVCLALTYVASLLGNVLQAALSLFGMIAGPLLGLFTLGMIFPWSNKWGALVGLICSLTVTFTMGIGNFIYKPPVRPPRANVTTVGCFLGINGTATNVTTTTIVPTTTTFASTMASNSTEEPYIFAMFEVSYIWIGFYAVLTCVVVGLIVSVATGYTKPETINPKLICPIFDIVPPFCFLPEKCRKPLRFGVIHEGKYDDVETDEERLARLEELDKRKLSDVIEVTLEVKPDGEIKARPNSSNGLANHAADQGEDGTANGHVVAVDGHAQNGDVEVTRM